MHKSQIGAILLVSGTTIGAAMVALPTVVAPLGLLGAFAVLLLFWALMSWSGLLFCELTLAMPAQTHLVTMAHRTLGPVARGLTWFIYLALLYSLCAAYLTGLSETMRAFVAWPQWVDVGLIIALFMGIYHIGLHALDACNRFLFFLFFIAFVVLSTALWPSVHWPPMQMHATHAFAVMPMVITSFGFHIIIPSLPRFMADQTHRLPRVVLLGSALPLLVYALWVGLVMGSPWMAQSSSSDSVIQALLAIRHVPWVSVSIQVLMISVVATSFIGVALGLFDFLKDGVRKYRPCANAWIWALTFILPAWFACFMPHGFEIALSQAGIFVAILLLIMPMLMVHHLRKQGHASGYQAPWHPLWLLIAGGVGLITIIAHWIGG